MRQWSLRPMESRVLETKHRLLRGEFYKGDTPLSRVLWQWHSRDNKIRPTCALTRKGGILRETKVSFVERRYATRWSLVAFLLSLRSKSNILSHVSNSYTILAAVCRKTLIGLQRNAFRRKIPALIRVVLHGHNNELWFDKFIRALITERLYHLVSYLLSQDLWPTTFSQPPIKAPNIIRRVLINAINAAIHTSCTLYLTSIYPLSSDIIGGDFMLCQKEETLVCQTERTFVTQSQRASANDSRERVARDLC